MVQSTRQATAAIMSIQQQNAQVAQEIAVNLEQYRQQDASAAEHSGVMVIAAMDTISQQDHAQALAAMNALREQSHLQDAIAKAALGHQDIAALAVISKVHAVAALLLHLDVMNTSKAIAQPI